MKTIIKKIALALLLVFIAIQFIPTKRNQNKELLATDFTKVYNVPNNIQNILKTSCYDCHSNNTKYPWYNKIQPVSWMLEHHINEAKEEVNFSDFGSYSSKKQNHKLDEMIDEIKENEMPLFGYKLMHPEAKISKENKKLLLDWLNSKMK